mgnify:CR=1 FL=1
MDKIKVDMENVGKIELQPKFALAFNNLGNFLKQERRYYEAHNILKKAIPNVSQMIRVMPNMPALVGESVSFLVPSRNTSNKNKNNIKIQNFKPVRDNKYAFIFGNEVDGIQDEIINVSDEVVEIPQVGTKHSLNVSVAAGIVLWDFFYKTEI